MANPTTQKSLVLYKESTPYVVAETPVPRPGPQEVLVKIIACALNPADAMVMDPPYSRTLIKEYPYVPGEDGAGVVVEVGAEVTSLKEGDKVLFQGTMSTTGATFQQYTVVSPEITAKIPDNITFEQAATVPLALTTTFMGLYNQSPAPENLGLRLKPIWDPEGATAYAGTPVLIVGGAGSLGQYAIQLAKMAGHAPIITTASPHNAALLQSLGATHVLDRTLPAPALLAAIRTAVVASGRPLAYALVAVADGDALRLARDALPPGGALGTVLPCLSHLPPDIANPGDGKRVALAYGSPSLPFTRDTALKMYEHLTGWLEQGLLKPNPLEVIPNGLAGINDGLARIKAGKVSGKKLVAHPQDTP
ncbi:GroES-like protein [Trametes elegans]|nr:GroES-like protein [Trametes elegans]